MQQVSVSWLFIVLWLVRSALGLATTRLDAGVRLFTEQQYAASQQFFAALLSQNSDDAGAHYYLGRIAFALGDYDTAILHGKKAVDLENNNPEYHFWLGRSYGAKAANADVAKQVLLAPKIKKAFEKTLELDPHHVKGKIGLAHFYLQAPGIMGGSMEKAAAQVQDLLVLDVLEGRLLQARLYEKQRNLAAAEAEYQSVENAYGQHRESAHLYNEYGQFLLRQKRVAAAIEKFTRQIELLPDTARPYESLGDGYRAAGQLQQAIEAYRQAIGLDPYAVKAKQKFAQTLKAMLSTVEDP